MEDVVGPVAVVDVPVEDQHPLGAPAIERPPGGHRDVVEAGRSPWRAPAGRDGPAGGAARRRRAGRRRPAARRRAPPRRRPRAARRGRSPPRRRCRRPARRRRAAHSSSMPRDVVRRVHGVDDARARPRGDSAHVPAQPVALGQRALDGRRSAPARSGCGPVSCSSDDGWRSRSGAAISLRYPRMAGPARIETDLVVVGAGAAGLYAALTAAGAGARVALVSATPLARTASYWAQGGLAAALARRRLARPAPRGHRARRARPRAHERRDRPVPRGAAHRGRPRAPRRALRRRPPRQPRARPRGRPLAPARRPRRRQRDRPARRAPALRRRGRDGRA